ncbi:helix-turn-helix domain-containing protein [Haloarcula argentinensis]|uniref:Helix-turn-helix domain-containing protein n=1 Tax=Haloarcula argentinensis TaxID=43776 RepID=A0A847UKM7_HALAR|nr:helix-turn-helix domain-containing protein [Haloarcula argentinensis]NLV12290.1 helix-turn-helix domain-containing protein [Haloarcula argentinensis]
MISLEMDMVQYDCPYIDTTRDYEVSFLAKQWDFHPVERELETRIMVNGADREELDRGLNALETHDHMESYQLLRRKDDLALIRSRIDETNAMSVIRDHSGYITGPFRIRDGSEIWHVGFDTERVAEGTLSELERDNDYTIRSRESVDLEDYYDLLQNIDSAKRLVDGCRELSEVERDTLEKAVEGGYFDTPRDATLTSLAEEFDVSKMAISKNLRRSQRKILDRVTTAMNDVTE